jgi:pyridoxine 5'-phosphate synthase PdxJ
VWLEIEEETIDPDSGHYDSAGRLGAQLCELFGGRFGNTHQAIGTVFEQAAEETGRSGQSSSIVF